ncbi:putative inorganic phosphate cotransporter isoform X3 [Palaemon carinicauda]|uniref:putative inorganic phosphate cotransporter isoform X3 n=1 Tax=Palaemon carinicauda TaxID=392227 RepID=UPI0035B5D8BD
MSVRHGDFQSRIDDNKDESSFGYGSDTKTEIWTVVGETRILPVENQSIKETKECWGTRYTLGIMGFLGVSWVYAMRVNLSVAIVAMVRPKNYTNGSHDEGVCAHPDAQNNTDRDENENGEFDWDESTQGLILSVFFCGYLITNLFGGRLAEYYGGKLVFGWGIFLTAILTLLTPLCAKASLGLFIAIRILEGVTEGVIFPAMNCMLASWIPPLERARFNSLVFSGSQFGTVVTLPVSGWLCGTDFLGGWPSVFYVFGSTGIIWGIGWYFLAYSQPEFHPRISQEEKAYIVHNCATSGKPIPIPWKAIFTSVPFWSMMITQIGYNWGFYTLLTELPTYLTNIQHMDMTNNGIMSALPYLIMWIFSLVYSNIMSHLLSTGKLSIIFVRRLSTAIGTYGPSIGLILMCFVNCNQVLAMLVLCIAVGLSGSNYSGISCSPQDLAPNLAGTILGFTNSAATLSGIFAPSVTGLIIKGNPTLWGWRTVFLISSSIYFVAGTVYIIFISADVQPWNFPQEERMKKRESVSNPNIEVNQDKKANA